MNRELQMNDWTSIPGYKVGDVIESHMSRSAWEIWTERVLTMRWHVRLTKRCRFLVTSTAPGAICPELK